jgi:hypothetical protein
MLGRIILSVVGALAGWALWRFVREQLEDGASPGSSFDPASVRLERDLPAADAEGRPAPPASGPIPDSDAEGRPAPTEPAPAEPLPDADAEGRPAPAEPVHEHLTVEAYCAHCRERRTISDAIEETTTNGRRAARGTCPVCGTQVFTFLPRLD